MSAARWVRIIVTTVMESLTVASLLVRFIRSACPLVDGWSGRVSLRPIQCASQSLSKRIGRAQRMSRLRNRSANRMHFAIVFRTNGLISENGVDTIRHDLRHVLPELRRPSSYRSRRAVSESGRRHPGPSGGSARPCLRPHPGRTSTAFPRPPKGGIVPTGRGGCALTLSRAGPWALKSGLWGGADYGGRSRDGRYATPSTMATWTRAAPSRRARAA
ncbi:hypothetical protein XINFAN_03859 [Pseudogemmobacter humi]|uniref:Uncharacterized protein n=1 Tax=Pseudogemmobacter humi TaxID=2483812 RepID=A0A3P5XWG6_9RHOB|nr:hypothetical protein XINFAN_03859 [Pseudogemmobacter humi]